MSTYEPGTVAVATVRGVPNVRVVAHYGTSEPRLRWFTNDERAQGSAGDGWHMYDVTDIRPLVVLDLEDPKFTVAALRDTLPEKARDHDRLNIEVLRLARQIEAQTKPPRIPEPGWGMRVVARVKGRDNDDYREFVHAYRSASIGTVWTDEVGFHASWSDLIDPSLVSDDIEDES